MKIELDNNNEITFERINNQGVWWAKIQNQNLETEFEFNENIFKTNNSNIPQIEYKNLQFIINKIINQIDDFKSKAENVLKCLHNEIFKNEFEEKQAYFDLICIQISNITKNIISDDYIEYSFELIYSLESKLDYLLDPYYQYKAKFISVKPHYIALSSVSRE